MKNRLLLFLTLLVFSIPGLANKKSQLDSLYSKIKSSGEVEQKHINNYNKLLEKTDDKYLTTTIKLFRSASNYNGISLSETTEILRKKVDDCEDWLHVEIFQVQDSINKGNVNGGIERARELIKNRDCKTDKQHYILIQAVGSGFYYFQKYDSAIHYFKKAVSISSKKHDTISILTNYVNIGSSYYGLGAYRSSLYYFQEALKLNKEYEGFDTRYVRNNMGAILNTIENYDEAAKYLMDVFPSKQDLKKNEDINILVAINIMRCKSDLIPDSLRTISINHLIRMKDKPSPYQTAVKTEVAQYYFENEQVDKARAFLKENKKNMMQDTAVFLDFTVNLFSQIDSLALTDKELKDMLNYASTTDFTKYGLVVEYMLSKNHWVVSKDSLFAQYHEKTSDFFEANDSLVKQDYSIYSEIKQKDSQISSLDKKVKKSERENQLLIIATISLALIVGLITIVFILFKKQTSYKLKLKEAREASLVKQKRLAEAKNKEAKTKEELISIKDNVFKELMPFFEELNKETKEMLPDLPKDTKIKYLSFQENLERLKTLLNIKEKMNGDVTHHSSSSPSKEKPDLTDREIRIARLITSGMSSKEIAVTLNRKASYVNNLRSNLRKKLNLDHNQSLEEELRKLNF